MILDFRKNQKGAVLLFALIVMFAVSSAGLVISMIVLNQIKLNRNTLEANKAYYAAESGLERGLYQIKISRAAGQKLEDPEVGVLKVISGFSEIFNQQEKTSYSVMAASYENNLGFLHKLLPNQSIQYNFYSPDNPYQAMGIEDFLLEWRDGCDGLSTVELSIYDMSNILAGESEDSQVYKLLFDCAGFNSQGLCNGASKIEYPVAAKSYVVRIKSIKKSQQMIADCPVYLDLSAETEAGGEIFEPNLLEIASSGKSGRSEAEKKAVVRWLPGVGAMADFVIFSEGDIKKY